MHHKSLSCCGTSQQQEVQQGIYISFPRQFACGMLAILRILPLT